MFVPILFHYLPNSEWNDKENTQRCDKLQKSLAETLTKFYRLAGRLSNGDLSIHCNDEGVEYVESKVNADLAEFLHEGLKIELLNDFLPTDLPSSLLLRIQVNTFNCGGLVIGINISHIIADGFTLGSFFKDWAHISQTGTTESCLPSFGHLPLIFPSRALSGPQVSPPSNIGPKIVTKRFVFDALAISKLKDTINSSATFIRPTLVVVQSFIWKVLLNNSSAKHGHSRGSSLLFPINLRGKSNLPSLEHALGSLFVTVAATLEANQLRKELSDFVSVVGSTTRDTCACIGKANINDIASMFVTCGTEVMKKLGQGDQIDIYPSNSWCRFPPYEADFGWGKPFWVSSVGKPFEVIILNDTKDGGGIEAWVSLKENEMTEFKRDLIFRRPLEK
ncbi:acetyl-CoA-benzylalcohol acetyltransferase-like [Lycium ferocissimum]|uniref:acetyl-CoA-benzylalcohol acetyltransferase-like n=1 Tax=Lycium ferocissimum TaxID=112874 RepID=UPI0028153DC6|nr:acetyl-CoA-benzylalcohol acetyltransferase-like [Lycium ferocissimum]